jgi:DnaJ-class molecular chaperone
MITYYCKCGGKGEAPNREEHCSCNKCGGNFGFSPEKSYQINMRNTWSGQTKVEFNTTTVAESVKKMGGDINR